MPLKLMYLTNDPQVAAIAQAAGVDRIFLDLELRGKEERQGHLDTVISHHSIEDVRRLKAVLTSAQLLVRVNSMYAGSEAEINKVIADGADIVMLPYFKTVKEVSDFVSVCKGRVKTCLLFETPEAVEHIDEILAVPGIDEVHVGINDLHLGYHLNFMFELVANGTVETLCRKFAEKGIPYGFGGVGRPGSNVALPAERILAEHYRLGSSQVILSRAFCDMSKIHDRSHLAEDFKAGVDDIRACEAQCAAMTKQEQNDNHAQVQKIVAAITGKHKG
ncbi:MAG TPA: aldolase [Candidatus Fimenecus excrementavium]|nr:aldolase [Candidatus Fimenecus excrementavium]